MSINISREAEEQMARAMGEKICPMIRHARIQFFDGAWNELFSNYAGDVRSGDTISIIVPTPEDFRVSE